MRRRDRRACIVQCLRAHRRLKPKTKTKTKPKRASSERAESPSHALLFPKRSALYRYHGVAAEDAALYPRIRRFFCHDSRLALGAERVEEKAFGVATRVLPVIETTHPVWNWQTVNLDLKSRDHEGYLPTQIARHNLTLLFRFRDERIHDRCVHFQCTKPLATLRFRVTQASVGTMATACCVPWVPRGASGAAPSAAEEWFVDSDTIGSHRKPGRFRSSPNELNLTRIGLRVR